jgi:hypothetical protein
MTIAANLAGRKPLLANRDAALYLGIGAWLLGSVLLWDAWEHRGRSRPFAFKLLGITLA